MEIFNRKMEFVNEQLRGRLDQDDVARICHTYDFNEEKIDRKLESYVTDRKYEGLEEYEWQTT